MEHREGKVNVRENIPEWRSTLIFSIFLASFCFFKFLHFNISIFLISLHFLLSFFIGISSKYLTGRIKVCGM
jgi:hypothetical protein